MTDEPETGDRPAAPRPRDGVAIPATCTMHGATGFANLMVSKRDGHIVLDPHVAGACVISLDEVAATALHGLLGEWLG